ncbi:hypothetical protein [Nannocystis punicea]|uniref:Lipocalin-like domain-containing protein n=1 Tax=Nannocystis punicea TaxID=2995304 RepID=A0ABY7GWD4_9BACT|nr:hypothetical protein [Nannocystis poenicansa]WAS91301.1 hypothetical protein O0S08_34370 [Nannocystis poenicansa]
MNAHAFESDLREAGRSAIFGAAMPSAPSNTFVRAVMSVASALLAVRCTPTTAEAPPEVAAPATPPERDPEPPIERRIQGSWKVLSSSVRDQDGGVFAALVGQTVSIDGDRFVYTEYWNDMHGQPIAHTTTKIITLPPGTSPQAIDLRQASDAKGWDRVGIIVVDGDRLFLSLTYPNEPRPTTMEPAADGREVVTLKRIPAAPPVAPAP